MAAQRDKGAIDRWSEAGPEDVDAAHVPIACQSALIVAHDVHDGVTQRRARCVRASGQAEIAAVGGEYEMISRKAAVEAYVNRGRGLIIRAARSPILVKSLTY